jgi:hypothetical protein
MAAPVLAIVAGWLSAMAATSYAPALLDVSRVETGVTIAYADIQKGCPLAQPLIDIAAARWPTRAGVARLARVTDALCAAVKQPDTPANQARALAAIVGAVSTGSAATARAIDPGAGAVAIPKRMCGRTAC